MPRAICYYRVSSDEQADSGAGLAAQRDACMRYAERTGLELLDQVEEAEGLSGEVPLERRTRLVEAVGRMKRGDVLLVAKRDRISRDNINIALFEAMLRKDKGCRLVSAAGEGTESLDPNDPVAFLTKGIVDLFSKFELLQLRFRTRVSMRAKRQRGERNGKTPYGWDLVDDGRRSRIKTDKKTGQVLSGGKPIALVPNVEEQDALRWMQKLREEGRSLAEIAAALTWCGIRTKAGKPWSRSSVDYVLKVSIPLLKAQDDGQGKTAGEAADAGRPAPGGDPGGIEPQE